MSARSCADCGAPLKAGDTVCPVGHHSEDKLESDLAALRAAVNDAFAAAESELQYLRTSLIQSAEAVSAAPDPVPSASALSARSAPLEEPTPSSIRATVAELSPQKNPPVEKPLSPEMHASAQEPLSGERERSMAHAPVPAPPTPSAPVASAPAPPPPPPPPASHAPLFVPRPAVEDRPDDPIAAFAPAPRLDWGPERAKGDGLRKRFNR